MLGSIDRWFEPVNPSQEYRQNHYVVLALLIVAGALVRFWHLDNVGLHGDEDIMGLAARGVAAHAVPVLPSGLVYWRAPFYTYLLAGSTSLFGDTEWALRLPSAIVGSLCGLLAFQVGKRFLEPIPNLGFVATIVFLPAMIEISQTARMYVFLVASLLLFAILLFRWERDGSLKSFIWTVLALALAIQFHRLAVFAAPMLLYPGFANKSWRQLLLASIAMLLAGGFSEWIGDFANQDYPDDEERLPSDAVDTMRPVGHFFLTYGWQLAILAAAGGATVAILALVKQRTRETLTPFALLLAGSIACALLHYHIGLLLLVLGVIGWARARIGQEWRIVAIAALVAGMAALQYWALAGSGLFSGREVVGAYVGTPSIWPTIRFMQFSPFGSAIAVFAAAVALMSLASRERIPIYFLYFAIAVWLALFAIGLFRWYTATRYTLGPLPFFLLGVFAGLAFLIKRMSIQSAANAGTLVPVIAMTAILTINPVAAWRVAANSYADHPDHKGAAKFIQSLKPDDEDVIVAEDSIVQAYYLRSVDYRLQSVAMARAHSFVRAGVLFDQYTGARIIGSGEELLAVFDEAGSRDVYVVSSSQSAAGLEHRNRANGIADVLSSNRLELLYVGRDRETKVWKLIEPPGQASASETSELR
jgi:4-amino-4-deoxy-L-arabinose transferase-like glycosyltransferase